MVVDLRRLVLNNDDFRRVIYTSGSRQQLVAMTVAPGDDIGLEQHDQTQFFYIMQGNGIAEVGGQRFPVRPGIAIMAQCHQWF